LATEGLPDDVIQTIIGWSTADLVRVYDDRPADKKLEKYFDENGIKAVESKSLSDL
jgi:hypothetical protein